MSLRALFIALALLGSSAQALTYRVRPGDSLFEIARRAGVSEKELRHANPQVKGDRIEAGQTLLMPVRVGAKKAPAPLAAGKFRVRQGETLPMLARRLGFTQQEIRKANPRIDKKGSLYAGQVLTLPRRVIVKTPRPVATKPLAAKKPAAPTTHRVRSGESFYSIARRYQMTTARLQQLNPRAAQGTLLAGTVLRLRPDPAPARSKPPVVRVASSQAAGTGHWMWPLPGHARITSEFGLRTLDEVEEMHTGIDIGAPVGTPVVAARSGRVIQALTSGDWGKTVVVQHPDGWMTRYAHLSAVEVQPGQLVRQGQRVGQVGETGRATGPHLHFGLYRGNQAVDPFLAYSGGAGR